MSQVQLLEQEGMAQAHLQMLFYVLVGFSLKIKEERAFLTLQKSPNRGKNKVPCFLF
ncbi:MAG: hypothetical protein ACI92E_001450 [Oceanicoccus sp.]|jgi:hypothetical protein